MAFCPVCKYEYRPGVSVCPDCQQTLVEQLPTPAAAAVKPDDSWVGVCQLSSGLRSELAKGALDSNNIPSMLMPSAYTGSAGSQSNMLAALAPSLSGEIMMVPKEFVQEAEIILEAVLGEDFVKLDAHRQ
jgi:hypothetical protein